MITSAPDSTSRLALPIICGPTAVGKTALALQLAEQYGCEVVSADSRQVYRLMDIGTAKPTPAEQARVPHHLIDVVWPDETYHVARYASDAATAIDTIVAGGRRPLLVGGTGLYIRALTEGLLEAPGADPRLRQQLREYAASEGPGSLHQRLAGVDPEAAARLHPNDEVRIIRALEVFAQSGRTLTAFQQDHGFREQPYRTLKIGLDAPREELYRRIDERAAVMFESGLVEEVESLLAAGYPAELKSMRTIGYRQAIRLLRGEVSRAEALADLQQATRRYAKQQLTWFRSDKSIIWVDSSADFVTIRGLIDNFYEG